MADGSSSLAADRLRAIIPVDRMQRRVAEQLAVPRAAATEVQETRWRGASRNLRSMINWLARVGSPGADQPTSELTMLRARSRDAIRNNPIGAAAIKRSRTAIVGTGIVCRPAIDHDSLGISEDQAKEYAAQLRAAFERWAGDARECDIESTLDFYGLTGLVLMSAMASGDCFASTPMELRPGGVNELKIQLFEADRISNPNDAIDTPACMQGIQLQGAEPVGCWLRNVHPGDNIDTRQPAWDYLPYYGEETGRRRVLHVWNDKDRPGQVRGVPFLAPVLEPLRQLERFSNAELMAAVLSAMLTVFIERDAEGQVDANGDPIAALPEDDDGNIALGNGAIVDLAPGEKANAFNPARPNANFEPFFGAIVGEIGATLEIPRDVLLLQFNASYSAARAAMLEGWRMFVSRRWWLTQQFCQPIYNLLVDEEVAAGRIRLPGYDDPVKRRLWQSALWVGPARGSMDEEKEARAARIRIDTGTSNLQLETAAYSGEDWDSVQGQREREVARLQAAGMYQAGASRVSDVGDSASAERARERRGDSP